MTMRRRLQSELLEPRLLLSRTPLANGEMDRREVGQEDRSDQFSFYASQGDRILIVVAEERVTATDIAVQLERPDGFSFRPVEGNDSVVIERDASFSGTYKIDVSEPNGSLDFDYRIRVIVSPAALQRTYEGDRVLSGGEEFVSILEAGEVNVAEVFATRGSYLRVAYGEVGPDPADPELRGFRPVGQRFSTKDNAPRAEYIFLDNSDPDRFTSTTGDYRFLLSEEGSDDQFTYSFRSLVIPADPDLEDRVDGSLASGLTVSDELPAGLFDVYTVYAQQGSPLSVNLTVTSPGESLPRVELLSPDGQLLESDAIEFGTMTQVEVTPSANGVYYVIVSDKAARFATTGFNYEITASGSFLRPSRLPGDYNRDFIVDELDYELWTASYGGTRGSLLRADGNGDGIVDGADYTVWRDQEGQSLSLTPPISSAVRTQAFSHLVLTSQLPSIGPPIGTSVPGTPVTNETLVDQALLLLADDFYEVAVEQEGDLTNHSNTQLRVERLPARDHAWVEVLHSVAPASPAEPTR